MKESQAPELSIGGKLRPRRKKERKKEGATVENEKKKSENACGLLVFLVYWMVCWFVGLLV